MSDENQIQNPEQGDLGIEKKESGNVELSEVKNQTASQNQVSATDQANVAAIKQTLNQPSPQAAAVNTQQPPAQSAKSAQSDDAYIKAAEKVIDKDKGDPYQEEEDHENVQAQYLKDRFGKDLKRG